RFPRLVCLALHPSHVHRRIPKPRPRFHPMGLRVSNLQPRRPPNHRLRRLRLPRPFPHPPLRPRPLVAGCPRYRFCTWVLGFFFPKPESPLRTLRNPLPFPKLFHSYTFPLLYLFLFF